MSRLYALIGINPCIPTVRRSLYNPHALQYRGFTNVTTNAILEIVISQGKQHTESIPKTK